MVLAGPARAGNHGGPCVLAADSRTTRRRARRCRPSRRRCAPIPCSRSFQPAAAESSGSAIAWRSGTPPSSSSRWRAPRLHIAQIGLGTFDRAVPADARQRHRSRRIQPPDGRTCRRTARLHAGSLPRRSAAVGRVLGGDPCGARRLRCLADKLDLYAASGRINLLDHESFEETDWAWLLLGSGCRPEAIELQIRLRLEKVSSYEVNALRTHVQQVAESMPRHIDFVRHQASSKPRAGA